MKLDKKDLISWLNSFGPDEIDINFTYLRKLEEDGMVMSIYLKPFPFKEPGPLYIIKLDNSDKIK